MEKCQCYIHSLKQGENHVLGEATILKRLGDNVYLAEYSLTPLGRSLKPILDSMWAWGEGYKASLE